MPHEILKQLPALYGFTPAELSVTPWESGRLACHSSGEIFDNPYDENSVPFSEWNAGFTKGSKEVHDGF